MGHVVHVFPRRQPAVTPAVQQYVVAQREGVQTLLLFTSCLTSADREHASITPESSCWKLPAQTSIPAVGRQAGDTGTGVQCGSCAVRGDETSTRDTKGLEGTFSRHKEQTQILHLRAAVKLTE